MVINKDLSTGISLSGETLLDVDNGRALAEKGITKPTEHFTTIFNTFVMMTLFNEINARKIHGQRNIFEGLQRNVIFVVIWIATILSQVLSKLFLSSLIRFYELLDCYHRIWWLCSQYFTLRRWSLVVVCLFWTGYTCMGTSWFSSFCKTYHCLVRNISLLPYFIVSLFIRPYIYYPLSLYDPLVFRNWRVMEDMHVMTSINIRPWTIVQIHLNFHLLFVFQNHGYPNFTMISLEGWNID